jgi:hypothetical protein
MIATLDKAQKGSRHQCNGSDDKKHLLYLFLNKNTEERLEISVIHNSVIL